MSAVRGPYRRRVRPVVSEPTTVAGRALLATLDDIREDYYPFADYPDRAAILAIEQEAADAAREAAIAAVENIAHGDTLVFRDDIYWVPGAVIDAIRQSGR